MRLLFGFPGWGWALYGLASLRKGHAWFFGFSKQLPIPACFGSKPDPHEQVENECHTCPSKELCLGDSAKEQAAPRRNL